MTLGVQAAEDTDFQEHVEKNKPKPLTWFGLAGTLKFIQF